MLAIFQEDFLLLETEPSNGECNWMVLISQVYLFQTQYRLLDPSNAGAYLFQFPFFVESFVLTLNLCNILVAKIVSSFLKFFVGSSYLHKKDI